MSVFRFSANLAYLWTELPFLERIRRAAANGFDAIEFHDNALGEDRAALRDALAKAGLPVLGLNVRMGETVGRAAIPEAADQARRDIAEAIEVAEDIGAGAIHVLAGKASGSAAHDAYIEALQFALANTGLTILIEPVCGEQVPGFFLRTIEQADRVLAEVDDPRLKIMFDCYHVQRESGSVLTNFRNHVSKIGHVQIAAAEERGEPFPGELDYGVLLPAFREAGYAGYFGCEYRPRRTTDEGLSWRGAFPQARIAR